MKRNFCFLLLLITFSVSAQVKNFTETGEQITKFDDLGRAVDAHDGKISYFNGTYYLYGTSYDCGFEWNNKIAPFCGFKTYSSKDMVNWKDEGFMFDAKSSLWQSRCDGKTYGCFRPHVVYNKKNKQYVLWINVYDNVIGYRVFTSKSPIGPFTEVAEPKIVVNKDKPAAGLNNGDHDLFIDDDGKAYIAITDWRMKGAIAIEELDDNYLSGTGKLVTGVTKGNTEAPGLFKRNNIYYVTYSDPNCGYCSGTGTSYVTAKSPLGPWSAGKKISDNSCGGQPSFVSTINLPGGKVFLYGSDLWNNAAKNEALANFYWAPLTFAEDGSINPMECLKSFKIGKKKAVSKDSGEFKAVCEITNIVQRKQVFTASKSGTLDEFNLATLKSGYPNSDLIIDFFEENSNKKLSSVKIPADAIGWSAKDLRVNPNFPVTLSKRYVFVVSTASTSGCFGYAKGKAANEGSFLSNDSGKSFKDDVYSLRFSYSVK